MGTTLHVPTCWHMSKIIELSSKRIVISTVLITTTIDVEITLFIIGPTKILAPKNLLLEQYLVGIFIRQKMCVELLSTFCFCYSTTMHIHIDILYQEETV